MSAVDFKKKELISVSHSTLKIQLFIVVQECLFSYIFI